MKEQSSIDWEELAKRAEEKKQDGYYVAPCGCEFEAGVWLCATCNRHDRSFIQGEKSLIEVTGGYWDTDEALYETITPT
jgi:hypothetical protein